MSARSSKSDPGLEKLWAPWRESYITRIAKKEKDNLFTRLRKDKKNDRKNYVFARTKKSYAVLNLYPYNNGHCLIIPNRAVNDLSKLRKDERDDLLDLLEDVKACLDKVVSPQGYNIGINLGRVAGAGIPEHLHIHIVPRWKGDVNFMPVTAHTKVISQSLQTLHQRLLDAYQKRNRKSRK